MKKSHLIICIFALILVFSLKAFDIPVSVNTISLENKEISGNPNNEKEEVVVDNTSTKPSSNYIIGSIKINGTNINNKLVQGKDNEYFLDHSPYGDIDSRGSIYMDYRNNFSDRKLLIYGHNSKTLKTALFHDLEKYLDYSFYKNNKYIDITLNGIATKYEIFSVMIVNRSDNSHMKITFNDKEWIEHINWMKGKSIYNTGIDVGLTDRIVTLQTCYYNPDNSYLIINAKKIK